MMRIINGHDYYDHASAWQDDTLFVREEELVEDTPFAIDVYIPEFSYVFVAGLTYPAFRARSQNGFTYLYDVDSAIEYVETFDNTKVFGWTKKLYIRKVRKHFKIAKDRYESWLIENHVVTGITENKVIQNGRYIKRKVILHKNIANLKDYDFFRVLDAWEAHNAISNYVGGVLSSDPEIVQLGNDDKIRKAGFDMIQSFRHRM